MESGLNGQVFTIIMLIFQSLITVLGTVIYFMVKRLVVNIDQLTEEDKQLRIIIYQHREDALIRINNLGQELYKQRERRSSARTD